MIHFVRIGNIIEDVTVKRGFILKSLELSKDYGDSKTTMFVSSIEGTADIKAYVVRMDTDIVMVDDVRYMSEESFNDFVLHETDGGEYIRVVVDNENKYPNWMSNLIQLYTSIDLKMTMDAEDQKYKMNLCEALRSLGYHILFSGPCILTTENPGNTLMWFRVDSGKILVKGPDDYSRWVRDEDLEKCMVHYSSSFEELSKVLLTLMPDTTNNAKDYIAHLKTMDIVKTAQLVQDSPVIKIVSHNGNSVRILLSEFDNNTVVLYGPSRPDSKIIIPNTISEDETYILMKVLLTTVQGFRTKDQTRKDINNSPSNVEAFKQKDTANFEVGKTNKSIVQGEESPMFAMQSMNVGEVKTKVLVGEVSAEEK